MTRIGVTGHSDLTPSSLPVVESALGDWLSGRTGPGWVGVSCLARGTDQLFAGLVLAQGGLLEVILPARDYRRRKVEPDNAAEFDRLLAAAATVTVLDFPQSCRQAYMSASTDMLAVVDTLVAVWDGKPPHRHGSTGDVVAAARSSGMPVSVIWPPTASRGRDGTSPLVAPARPPEPTARGLQPARLRLRHALDGLCFPAHRWEIVLQAEFYGADHGTRRLLDDLPEGQYASVQAVLGALAPPSRRR